ncbi:hypothetical protein BKA83DRAFT_4329183, partial [Pisolithus microcarpus]
AHWIHHWHVCVCIGITVVVYLDGKKNPLPDDGPGMVCQGASFLVWLLFLLTFQMPPPTSMTWLVQWWPHTSSLCQLLNDTASE